MPLLYLEYICNRIKITELYRYFGGGVFFLHTKDIMIVIWPTYVPHWHGYLLGMKNISFEVIQNS